MNIITLGTVCEILKGSIKDATIYVKNGYIFLEIDGEVYRLSLDKNPLGA